ncbi:hypothetical protein DDB_G0270592 [Dictyostelium discoideum AX4]|uniref:Uncharacterized protein n=1 Tax=Dictyostelium discoideum TaxID=44689 RepID=Q55DJ1_DICDI|nr:hypothetical protein DDB_G0270592 [Dictyostelium discoideum AX4]EAL72646.1 hypothetical protein DDB_G0270592 [Dictyostelium discoideum AX4]|eukprot:XP_646140.1 hypothetical protein DDB_G0270592 [Dictyostelium discoideum AX4]
MPLAIWDDFVHKKIICFTNRYALEAIVKRVYRFQKPCVMKKRNGKYISVHLFVEFVQDFSSFKVYVINQYTPDLDSDLSSEYICREFLSKNCCLALDDII